MKELIQRIDEINSIELSSVCTVLTKMEQQQWQDPILNTDSSQPSNTSEWSPTNPKTEYEQTSSDANRKWVENLRRELSMWIFDRMLGETKFETLDFRQIATIIYAVGKMNYYNI